MASMKLAVVLFVLVLTLHVVLNSANDGKPDNGSGPPGKPEENRESENYRMWKAVCTDGQSAPEKVQDCAQCFGDAVPRAKNEDYAKTADYKAAKRCVDSYLSGKAAECRKYLPGDDVVDATAIGPFKTCALFSELISKFERCMEMTTGEEFSNCMYPHLKG